MKNVASSHMDSHPDWVHAAKSVPVGGLSPAYRALDEVTRKAFEESWAQLSEVYSRLANL